MAPKVSVIVPIYNVKQYLANSLDSIAGQKFDELEVLLIDDGSSDGSAEIAKAYAAKDRRYRYIRQENAGVSAARNRGIEEAKGDYLAFYDADDIVPEKALISMYKVGETRKADIVIGIMEEKSLGESLLYMHSVKLSSQRNISPLDKNLFGAWSICNKLFRREFIIKNNLRLEPLKNAEDGVFTFCALQKAKRIYGCRVVAYNYIKRPFWESASATQTISRSYMESLLKSHERILAEANKLAESNIKSNRSKINIYLRPLYIRFIEGELLNGYYRGIWRADEDLTERINEKLAEYKKHIQVSDWKALCKRHRDLNLEEGLIPLGELAGRPLVSIILTSESSPKYLNLQVASLYNQLFPRFEIILSKRIKDDISDNYASKANIKICDDEGLGKDEFIKKAFDMSLGEYVIFADERLLFTKNTIRNMWSMLETKKTGCASVMVKSFDGESYSYIDRINSAYGYGAFRNMFISRDYFVSNKMIRKSVLMAEPKFPIVCDEKSGAVKLFERSILCSGTRKSTMIAPLDEAHIKRLIDENPASAFDLFRARVNAMLDRFMNHLKKYLTKDDVNKIRKRFKK